MQYGPDPNAIYPNEEIKNICYIKNVITHLEALCSPDLEQVKALRRDVE